MRRLAVRVGGRDEQPAEEADVLQEVDLLVGTLLLVGLLPEAVPGQRGRDERGGQRGGRQAGELAQGEQGARHDLHTGVDLDQGFSFRAPLQRGVLHDLVDGRGGLVEDGLDGGRQRVGIPQLVDSAEDEHGGEGGSGYTSQDWHGAPFPGPPVRKPGVGVASPPRGGNHARVTNGRRAIGLDIGGTKVAGAIVGEDGTVHAELRRKHPGHVRCGTR
ncbi:hypothetical protein [Pseudonocardia sp. ICBG601]|uniref:hypothetical protein n=1 Tax=Pseudonocardia sp. ICBG601 TaxID=2846759 RepID=UPI0021F5EFF3|nr:hypothetical protein [Pseudonocardia sp. ICBG601]